MSVTNRSFSMEDSQDSPLRLQKSYIEGIEDISMPSVCSDVLSEMTFIDSPSTPTGLHRTSGISDANNTLNCTDYLSKEINEDLKIKRLFIDKKLENEIHEYKNLLDHLNRAQVQRAKTNLIIKTLNDMFENSVKLPNRLKKKCLARMEFHNLMKNLNYKTDFLTAIGIRDTPEAPVLTEEEKRLIQLTLKEELEKKFSKMKIENEMIHDYLGNHPKSMTLPGSVLTGVEAKMLGLFMEISKKMKSCYDKFETINQSIGELRDCRILKFRKLLKEEVECLVSRTKLLDLKIKNLNYMIENSIVQENDDLSRAVDTLHKELKSALDDAEYSLQKTKSMKESYDSLKGTKFNEVLREFMELRESFQHKQWALKQMRNPE